jgi:tRNA-splicing endonuclease subunit Sen34
VIKGIREQHNIVGVPVGTLLQLPTQNVFLGTPFEYTPEEIALLHSRNSIKILNGTKAARRNRSIPRRQQKSSPYGMFLEFPKEWRRTGKLLPEPLPPPSTQVASPGTDLELSTHVPRSEGTMFRVYQYLNQAGYWMTPGLRFGCEYTAYPGDPLRFHSHFMVHVEKDEDGEEGVDMLTLVGGGRVATQTRKAWMLAGQVDGQVRVFSIEWAGFG